MQWPVWVAECTCVLSCMNVYRTLHLFILTLARVNSIARLWRISRIAALHFSGHTVHVRCCHSQHKHYNALLFWFWLLMRDSAPYFSSSQAFKLTKWWNSVTVVNISQPKVCLSFEINGFLEVPLAYGGENIHSIQGIYGKTTVINPRVQVWESGLSCFFFYLSIWLSEKEAKT